MEKRIFEVKQTDAKGLILSRLYVETSNAVAALLTYTALGYRVPGGKLTVRTSGAGV